MVAGGAVVEVGFRGIFLNLTRGITGYYCNIPLLVWDIIAVYKA